MVPRRPQCLIQRFLIIIFVRFLEFKSTIRCTRDIAPWRAASGGDHLGAWATQL